MTPDPVEIVLVRGTHREVGHQMGEWAADRIRAEQETLPGELPAGRTWDDQLSLAAEYRTFTEPRLPWLMEELDACADAAGVDRLGFFAASVEEIWYAPRDSVLPSGATGGAIGRCSDLVAGPNATANGHLLVGHTNDLHPSAEAQIVGLEKRVTGDPAVFQLGGVPWLSVGWNAAGLSLTGNELSPNDERVGISRSHQVLEMMRARSLSEMVAMALRPDRASSYNNVLTSADGDVANVEGSATDAEVTGLDDTGHLAHTNHYVCDRMLPFEGDPAYAQRSDVRYRRARALLEARSPGSITEASMREMLADHEGAPDSICRHPGAGDGASGAKTVFWCIADVTAGSVTFGRGNPCDSTAQHYEFQDYPEAA